MFKTLFTLQDTHKNSLTFIDALFSTEYSTHFAPYQPIRSPLYFQSNFPHYLQRVIPAHPYWKVAYYKSDFLCFHNMFHCPEYLVCNTRDIYLKVFITVSFLV